MEDRERGKERGEEKQDRREEGKKVLRELIILFNHILDESQVIRGTLRERGGERGESGGAEQQEVEKKTHMGGVRQREERMRTGGRRSSLNDHQNQPCKLVHARASGSGGRQGGGEEGRGGGGQSFR